MKSKGIVYLMTTAVPGLVKIGQTQTNNFSERMRFLESNGYYNVSGLKKAFAIELEDYKEKEKMLHDVFTKQKIGESELFALDIDLIKQLLLSFEGKMIYPKTESKEKDFEEISKTREQGRLFSFYRKGLKNGDEILFVDDETIKARIVGEREVEYDGQVWKLSPLTYMIYEKMGRLTASGSYQGANYFKYDNRKLKDLPDIN